ncbi:hypothetical protein JCGZ_15547 [Jatropha curcas]|uniref:Uncharacterized protein n=1 Tax=Jatropha curcas TaxID=180498 RepID=A0A067KFZ0_JATCU|nr:hypothetical protein JCGZ_15547 [Jatropha curcas]
MTGHRFNQIVASRLDSFGFTGGPRRDISLDHQAHTTGGHPAGYHQIQIIMCAPNKRPHCGFHIIRVIRCTRGRRSPHTWPMGIPIGNRTTIPRSARQGDHSVSLGLDGVSPVTGPPPPHGGRKIPNNPETCKNSTTRLEISWGTQIMHQFVESVAHLAGEGLDSMRRSHRSSWFHHSPLETRFNRGKNVCVATRKQFCPSSVCTMVENGGFLPEIKEPELLKETAPICVAGGPIGAREGWKMDQRPREVDCHLPCVGWW